MQAYKKTQSNNRQYKNGKQIENNVRKEWKKNKSRCVICGKNKETTKDHIPPLAIFNPPPFPKDAITVPSCNECQKTHDKEFQFFLGHICLENGVTESAKNLVEYSREKFIRRKFSNDFSRELIKNDTTKIISPKHRIKWPDKYYNPIILKIIYGYYWLLTEGKVLCDEQATIHFKHADLSNPEVRILVDKSFPSINIGRGKFIMTHLQGFDEGYDHIFAMGLHFHSDNNFNNGYHILVHIVFDKFSHKLSKNSKKENGWYSHRTNRNIKNIK